MGEDKSRYLLQRISEITVMYENALADLRLTADASARKIQELEGALRAAEERAVSDESDELPE